MKRRHFITFLGGASVCRNLFLYFGQASAGGKPDARGKSTTRPARYRMSLPPTFRKR
jgi:hypothetical protein